MLDICACAWIGGVGVVGYVDFVKFDSGGFESLDMQSLSNKDGVYGDRKGEQRD